MNHSLKHPASECNVLLIEDDPFHAELFRLAWEESQTTGGLSVASNGEQGLRMLGVGDATPPAFPHLVVLDWNLPGRNGKEVLAEIRGDQRFETVPVVVFSTSPAPNGDFAIDFAGAEAYLVKPLKYSQLVEAIRGLVARWSTSPPLAVLDPDVVVPTAALRVLLVDDHSVLAEAMRLSVADGDRATPPIDLVVADNLDVGAVVISAQAAQPDVVLVDLDLGGGRSGLELIAPLIRAGMRVVMFTGQTRPEVIGAGLESGAMGVIYKSDPFETMVHQVAEAARGRGTINSKTRNEFLAAVTQMRDTTTRNGERLASLTTREHEVLEMMMRGFTAAEIAAASFVSLATVRSQIKSILRKLGVTSQLAAVAMVRAEANGLVGLASSSMLGKQSTPHRIDTTSMPKTGTGTIEDRN